MIVILEDSVFSSPRAGQARLVNLFHLGIERRHRIQTDPIYEPGADRAANRWLDRQDEQLRDEIELALSYGVEADASGIPADVTLRVVDSDRSDWSRETPRLSLQDACTLLERPLKLLLENRRNDWAFLLAVSPEPWRQMLKRAEEERRLEPEHGGGLPEMENRIEALLAKSAEARRLWTLFDSDAREPGKPSGRSEAVRKCCRRKGVGYHQLQRREVENYLPLEALFAWAAVARRGDERRKRRQKAEAFAAMESIQRHHYNMKNGFVKDRKPPNEIPEHFGSFAEHPDLQSGFGGRIGEIFHQREFEMLEDWFLDDGQRDEMLPAIQSIFRLL